MERELTFRPAEPRDAGLILTFIRALAEYEGMLDQVTATEDLLGEWLFEKEAARVLFAVSGALEALPRGEIDWDLGTEIRMNSVEEQPRVFKEHMDVSQGKLAIGWRLGECMEEPDMAKLRVFNAVYGGSVTSKLFTNVREKRSLCYYASSGVDIQKGLLLVSSAVNFENFGAAREEILAQLEAGRDVLLDIEVQGALQVKRSYPDAVLIFIAAPSFGELEYRLRTRGDTAEDAVRLRLQTARREYEQANCYDYIVANDDIDRCVQKLLAILTAEGCRRKYNDEILKEALSYVISPHV